MSEHIPSPQRYAHPESWFRRCGRSGLVLPAISLGCWHNFGAPDQSSAKPKDEATQHRNCQHMLFTAFDHGIFHFDLANNYGPPPGSAEARVGRILREDLAAYRDELLISSKAGYAMWPGPFGEWGSRKSLIASCDQSLRRLGLPYVDIFYSHRPDPKTPVEETMGALDQIVRSGKALYVALSNYSPEQTRAALAACERHGFAKPILHQPRYNLLDRNVERAGLFPTLRDLDMGSICFSPLQGGLLTGKYLDDNPKDSRRHAGSGDIADRWFEPGMGEKLLHLRALAGESGRTLTQLALAWVLREGACTSALIGASRPAQIEEACRVLAAGPLDAVLLAQIEALFAGA
jgi:L-glyceraldehyde 3-phosphate reductase